MVRKRIACEERKGYGQIHGEKPPGVAPEGVQIVFPVFRGLESVDHKDRAVAVHETGDQEAEKIELNVNEVEDA